MKTGGGDHGPTSDPASPSPARVAHFRILGQLGQGGMGVVYRAEDERFLREARSVAAV